MTQPDALRLRHALNADTVRTNVPASSWEQAVERVGSLMVAAELVEPGYIEAMKNTLRELGPYSVIAPGIAMPHARPEDGVIQTGFALITLQSPVEFGSTENDPVDIVIAFAASSKQSHIVALKEIATLFGDQHLVAQIRSAETSEQLLDAIHQVEHLSPSLD